jgi:hypothetical protein
VEAPTFRQEAKSMSTTNDVKNPDGSTTEHFDVPLAEDALVPLVRTLFEEHWGVITYGPRVPGAVFELRCAVKPHVDYSNGYLTVGEGSEARSHFHLCVGEHRATRPIPAEVLASRRCVRAAFYRERAATGQASSWGLRLWNGRGDQIMTILFPSPWLDAARRRVTVPDWSRLALWLEMRARYAGVAVDADIEAQ